MSVFFHIGRQHLPSSLLICLPLDRGVVQEHDDVRIRADGDSYGRNQVGECQLGFRLVLQYLHQQICYHRHPDLDFDGILVVSEEIFQGEVLLHFFVLLLSAKS